MYITHFRASIDTKRSLGVLFYTIQLLYYNFQFNFVGKPAYNYTYDVYKFCIYNNYRLSLHEISNNQNYFDLFHDSFQLTPQSKSNYK